MTINAPGDKCTTPAAGKRELGTTRSSTINYNGTGGHSPLIPGVGAGGYAGVGINLVVIIILGLAMASMFVGLDRLLSRKAKLTPAAGRRRRPRSRAAAASGEQRAPISCPAPLAAPSAGGMAVCRPSAPLSWVRPDRWRDGPHRSPVLLDRSVDLRVGLGSSQLGAPPRQGACNGGFEGGPAESIADQVVWALLTDAKLMPGGPPLGGVAVGEVGQGGLDRSPCTGWLAASTPLAADLRSVRRPRTLRAAFPTLLPAARDRPEIGDACQFLEFGSAARGRRCSEPSSVVLARWRALRTPIAQVDVRAGWLLRPVPAHHLVSRPGREPAAPEQGGRRQGGSEGSAGDDSEPGRAHGSPSGKRWCPPCASDFRHTLLRKQSRRNSQVPRT